MPIEQKIFGKTPFTITNEMKRKARDIASKNYCEIDKAEAIFDWMCDNIEYDYSVQEGNYIYKTAHHVYYTKKGVCLDQSYLYTTLAREVGLKAGIASVMIDEKGESVCHACSSLNIEGDLYLVDIAYKKFDIEHQSYERFTDKGTIGHYLDLSHSYEETEEGIYKKSEDLESKIANVRNLKINDEMVMLQRKKDQIANDFNSMMAKVSGLAMLAYAVYRMNH